MKLPIMQCLHLTVSYIRLSSNTISSVAYSKILPLRENIKIFSRIKTVWLYSYAEILHKPYASHIVKRKLSYSL
jgi:hypothetical protein